MSLKRNKEMGFDEWMSNVANAMVRMCGMGPEDLPDYCYRDAFDAGDSVTDAAADAVDNAKGY